MGVSTRLFKLQSLSLFKLLFSISGEKRSLNEHLRATFGLKWAVKTPKPKTRAQINSKAELKLIHKVYTLNSNNSCMCLFCPRWYYENNSLRLCFSLSLRPFGPRAPECPKCPECVPGVSKRCPGHFRDTLGTLFGPGPEGPQGHFVPGCVFFLFWMSLNLREIISSIGLPQMGVQQMEAQGASALPSRKSATIGLFHPASALFALSGGPEQQLENQKRRKKAFCLRYPLVAENPTS